jgi:N-methylhydantoinase A
VLDAERSRAGIAGLARRLKSDLSVEQLAEGIIEIANWNQANCIHQMTIQRGIDPRGFALLSFGGAGPAQSAAVMELMKMHACLVPSDPGNLSAFGLLAVDWRSDHILTRVMPETQIDLAAVAEVYARLEAEVRSTLARDGIASNRVRISRQADLRYAGQSMETRVPAPDGPVDARFLAHLVDSFHAAHNRLYGYDYKGEQQIELVNFCVSGFGLIDRPVLPRLPSGAAVTPARKGERPVFFASRFRDTPVYERAALPAGWRATGPLVIEEFGSTSVVFPGQQLAVDPHGTLIIEPEGRT